MMAINKFGAMLRNETNEDDTICKSYVRWNTLCLDGDAFNARDRKIGRLAYPTNDDDAVNKLYLDKKMMHILKICDAKCSKLQEEIIVKVHNLHEQMLNVVRDTIVKITSQNNSGEGGGARFSE